MHMDQQRVHGVRKTSTSTRTPLSAQEPALEPVLSRCRTRHNAAVEQRKTGWERGQGKRATSSQQQAELPDRKAACPEYAAVNAPVLHAGIVPVERAVPARPARPASAGYRQTRRRALPAC